MTFGAALYLFLVSWGCFIEGDIGIVVKLSFDRESSEFSDLLIIRNKEERIYASVEMEKMIWKETRELVVERNIRNNGIRNRQFIESYDNTNSFIDRDDITYAIQPASKKLPKGVERNFLKNCLKTHNELRAIHGSPPLKLDPKLSEYAQEWADDLAARGLFEHRQAFKYGENLVGEVTSKIVKCDAIVRRLYSEIERYNFELPHYQYGTGHFTQIVWKSSERLGVGIARGVKFFIYVFYYDPPGNDLPLFAENVFPPIKKGRRSVKHSKWQRRAHRP